MPATLLLRQVNLLEGPGLPARASDVLVEGNRLVSLDLHRNSKTEADQSDRQPGKEAWLEIDASQLWLGPALVDPHSVLDDPHLGRAETLTSLAAAARTGGYGTVALLPWGPTWRDRPEYLKLSWPEPMQLLLWGAFSQAGDDRDLAAHADQLTAGACGLACSDAMPPVALLERGLRLAEMGHRPVLVAPRDLSLTQQGFVRERVEALRGGWPVDPPLSELLPLQTLLSLADALPEACLRLMNLSTAEAVEVLRQRGGQPLASVAWWHLIADSGSLDPSAEGWRMVPSLGGPEDRQALIAALADGTLTAVAVQHEALDAEERLLPLDQRRPGVAGHGLVLPLLWRELVQGCHWHPSRLWQALCWGPCRFLGLMPSRLKEGSSDWILFDPSAQGGFETGLDPSLAANRPEVTEPPLSGAVVASGLSDPGDWLLPGCPSR
jgi:dihydroorotase